jgi:limonene-1,2-epoxide hydrolase
MASETATGSNIEIVWEYTERVFNQHSPDLAAKYLAPGVTWHGQTLGTIEGVDNVPGMLRGFIGALPDLHAAEQDIVAAGEQAFQRMYARTQDRDQPTTWTTRQAQYDVVCAWGIPDHALLQRLSAIS